MHEDEPPRGGRDDRGEEQPVGSEDDRSRRRFVEDLVARGEVVPEDTDPLPPGVTHEVLEDKGGMPTEVRRRRFSISD